VFAVPISKFRLRKKPAKFLEHRVVYKRADDGESHVCDAALSKPHGTDHDFVGYNNPPELRNKLRHLRQLPLLLSFLSRGFQTALSI
jgi:hypothetical protein